MPRHHEVSRLEGFSDAVFGFALTLLVVSLEVPSDYAALLTQMEGFLGFALMFAMVCWIWYEHNYFFRRTGLQDPWTVFLNSMLLFVVLFYVYPMKFLTAALMWAFFGLGAADGPRIGAQGEGGNTLMVLYSIGVILIFGTFVLLYGHAVRRGADREWPEQERLEFHFSKRSHLISAGMGAWSLLVSLAGMAIGWPWAGAVAGFSFFFMGPLHAWNGVTLGRRIQALRVTADPAPDA